jgi:hypothetical protein
MFFMHPDLCGFFRHTEKLAVDVMDAMTRGVVAGEETAFVGSAPSLYEELIRVWWFQGYRVRLVVEARQTIPGSEYVVYWNPNPNPNRRFFQGRLTLPDTCVLAA